jgi:CHAT domain-containing protein
VAIASPAVVNDLLAAATTTGRLAHLRTEGLADETGLDWLLDRAQELIHDEPGMAYELAELCEAAAAELDLGVVHARSSYLRGRIHAERGEFDRALEFIDRARRGWSEAGQWLAALRSDLGRMHVLDDLGRHADAAAVGEALLGTLDMLASQTDQPMLYRQLRAMAVNNLGAAYTLTGDHGRALEAYAQAEADYLALGMREETARPLANRGICLIALGRPREALQVLGTAADLFTRAGDRHWAAKCAGDIASAHRQLGELVDALRLLEPARATLDQLGAHAEAARIQLATAEAYLAAGLFSEADTAAAAAAQRTLAQGMTHDNALATFTLALARLGTHGFDAAARELSRAAELFDQVGDREYRARVMLAQAELADQCGLRAEALAHADAAVERLQAGGWLIPLAWAKLRQADLVPAEQTAARLAGAAGLVEELSLPGLRYAYQLRLARLHRREGREEQAESVLRGAVGLAEELGSALPDPTLRVAFRAANLGAHDELLDLLVARGRPDDLAEACRIGDRGKAQTLIESATATIGRRRLAAGLDAQGALIDQHCADLSAVYGAMADAAQPEDQRMLRRRAAELEQEISALRLRRSLEAPPGEAVAAAAGSAGDLPASPALAYHVVGESVISFVLRDGQVKARRIGAVLPAVTAEIDRLVAQWSRFRVGTAFTRRNEASLLATTQDSLRSLYRLLVAPVEDLLAGLEGTSLAVIPHRSLHRVPFHILHDGTGYLCEQRTITLMPSIARVRPAAGSSRQPGSGTLILAVPDSLAPSIAAEAQELAAVMPAARLLLGRDASSQRLRAELPGPAVLHLACHGLYRAANPLFSALRLGDRWVNAAEILDLDLGGALVTLSACESGRPSVDSAEPVGLAWAFLAAGASGVVVSQWLVDDDATAGLMSAMYAGLAQGLPPAQALRQAQLGMAASSPHPYRWAPFVYVASPSAEPVGDIHDQALFPGAVTARGHRGGRRIDRGHITACVRRRTDSLPDPGDGGQPPGQSRRHARGWLRLHHAGQPPGRQRSLRQRPGHLQRNLRVRIRRRCDQGAVERGPVHRPAQRRRRLVPQRRPVQRG